MQLHKPSRTAEYMAYFRALESARPAGRRLFHDPFAPSFLSANLRAAALIARLPFAASIVDHYTDFRLPGARTSAIARTRLIDDSLLDAITAGFSQIVILGSGFDCRAYRLPQLNRTTVFEVDHPATLATKLSRLHHVLPKLPDYVRYVETDFMRQSLPEVLPAAGFQLSRLAVFIWEGVTQYLTADAVDAVLRFIAMCSSGTRLLFTYVHAGMLDGAVRFKADSRLLRGYASLGEPWIFGLFPERCARFLSERGIVLKRDWSANEYRKLYYDEDADHMRGYEFYHTVLATVSP